jgi:uncharacterized protein YlxP (DUF503 family)
VEGDAMPSLKAKRNVIRPFVKGAKSREELVYSGADTSSACDLPVTYFEIDPESVRNLKMKFSSLRSLWRPSSEFLK